MTSKTHLIENAFGKVAVLEQGAHPLSWVKNDKEQLFVSDKAIFQRGVAVRGGVPVCFPQFATFGSGQKHGFARNQTWQLSHKQEDALAFRLISSDDTNTLWQHDFILDFEVKLSKGGLQMALQVHNTGNEAFDFGAALHTYFRCDDVHAIHIAGLRDVVCWDNGTPFTQRYVDKGADIRVNGPIDRVYFDAPDSVQLSEGEHIREITKTGFPDIVVWNPWSDGAKAIDDLGDDEYLNMVCIEAAIVDSQLTLAAGKSWRGEQIIDVKAQAGEP